jgi:hypothetical protein
MRPVFADLVAEIQRSIGFYSSVHRDAKINKIYALGGTFKLPGLQKYLQQNLQLPVERLDSLAAGAPSDPKHAATFGDNLLSIVGAYGLAVQAMGGSVVTSSLLPRAIQRERMWQDKTKWFALAAGLMLAGVVVNGARWFLEDLQYKNAVAVRDQNIKTLATAEDLSSRWATVQNSGETERTIIGNLQTLVEGKYLWRDLETDLINAIPRPPEPLRTALANSDVEGIKKIPRGERPIIQIEEISPSYDPNMMATITSNLAKDPNWRPGTAVIAGNTDIAQPMSNPGEEPPAPDAGAAATADAAGKGRGFIIRMRLTTPLSPNQAAQIRGVPLADAFVDTNVQQALLAIAPNAVRPNMKYAVRKFWVLQRTQLGGNPGNPARKARLQADYDAALHTKPGKTAPVTPGTPPPAPGFGPGGAFGGGGSSGFGGFGGGPATPPANAAAEGNNPASQDRLTGESMLNDFEFEIAVAVELDPQPWQKPQASDQTASK